MSSTWGVAGWSLEKGRGTSRRPAPGAVPSLHRPVGGGNTGEPEPEGELTALSLRKQGARGGV